MLIKDLPLNPEQQLARREYSLAGAKLVGLSPAATPTELVHSLRIYLDAERQAIAAQSEHDEDAYADAILSLAYLLGEQICRAYAYEWIQLEFDGQYGGVNIVAPDRSTYVNTIRLIKDIVDQPTRANNTALLFSTLVPEVLAQQLTEADRRPGRYLGLH